ncbi:DUF397 domain-containing protein [Streptomyces drozdowiczii]
MNTHILEAAVWRTSSYSGQGGDCVEVADGVPGYVPVRDSKVACGPVVAFASASWSAFVAGAKDSAPSVGGPGVNGVRQR